MNSNIRPSRCSCGFAVDVAAGAAKDDAASAEPVLARFRSGELSGLGDPWSAMTSSSTSICCFPGKTPSAQKFRAQTLPQQIQIKNQRFVCQGRSLWQPVTLPGPPPCRCDFDTVEPPRGFETSRVFSLAQALRRSSRWLWTRYEQVGPFFFFSHLKSPTAVALAANCAVSPIHVSFTYLGRNGTFAPDLRFRSWSCTRLRSFELTKLASFS